MKSNYFSPKHVEPIIASYVKNFQPPIDQFHSLKDMAFSIQHNSVDQQYVVGSRWSGRSILGFKRDSLGHVIPYFEHAIEPTHLQAIVEAKSANEQFEKEIQTYFSQL